MNRRNFVVTAGAMIGASMGSHSCAAEQTQRPRVLLLGDSISIGYTEFVVGMLWSEAEVSRPIQAGGVDYENCEGTTKALTALDRWLGDTAWNVIHFNFGLHDLKRVDPISGEASRNPQHPRQASPKEYRENMDRLIARLQKTGARLIFATTTPVPMNSVGPLRTPQDCEVYNREAAAIMQHYKIAVNDLYAFAQPRMSELYPSRNVHPTRHGYLQLAQRVADSIRRSLAFRS